MQAQDGGNSGDVFFSYAWYICCPFYILKLESNKNTANKKRSHKFEPCDHRVPIYQQKWFNWCNIVLISAYFIGLDLFSGSSL